MTAEVALPFVDSKTVAVTGTPEALTTREIACTSVYLVAASANAGATVYIVDSTTTSKKIRVPAGGLTLPVQDPRDISVDVDTNGDKVEWLAA